MAEQELQEYIRINYPKEDDACEWKEMKNLKNDFCGKAKDDVVSYVSALSNMEGGHLIVGVVDKTLEIVGTDTYNSDVEKAALRLTDAVLLDSVQKGKRISAEAIAMLRKRKLIEGRLPHIYVAKDIAQVTNHKVEYTKHKGLNDKKCEALLIDSLKDHGSLTKPEIVRLLWDILPDQLDEKQKNTKIYNILRKLREFGEIVNKTVGNKSRWSLANH